MAERTFNTWGVPTVATITKHPSSKKSSLPGKYYFLLVLVLLACVLDGTLIPSLLQSLPSLLQSPTIPTHWYTLEVGTSNAGLPEGTSSWDDSKLPVSSLMTMIFNSDIGTPMVKALSGKAKFLPPVSATDHRVAIGYTCSVSLDPLDRSKLREKYKKERIVQSEKGPITVLPLDEATYEVYFILRFLDRDGFELLITDSPKHHIQSGKINHIQAKTEPLITQQAAAITDKITIHMIFTKCLSARANLSQGSTAIVPTKRKYASSEASPPPVAPESNGG
jgi:hypothetical protein